MMQKTNYDFNDQSLVAVETTADSIHLEIDCWDESTDVTHKGAVTFSDIQDMTIQSEAAFPQDFKMMSQEGEIIRFKIEEQRATIVIIWHGYKNNNANSTLVYKFTFDHMDVKP